MRRTSIILLLVLVGALPAGAQLPTYAWSHPGYIFNDDWTQSIDIYNCIIHGTDETDFVGSAYRLSNDTLLYGVAAALDRLYYFPYIWVMVAKDHSLGDGLYTIDTVWKSLYCFIEHPPVPIAYFQGVSANGAVTNPLYEFYFDDPIPLQAGVRYYVGIEHSEWNNYNLVYKEAPGHYMPSYLDCTRYIYYGRQPGIDTTWCWDSFRYGNPVNWSLGQMLEGWAIFPIVQEPDSIRRQLNHIHHTPLVAEVEHLRQTLTEENRPKLQWDSIAPSEFGMPGINVSMYEIEYAKYNEPYDSGHVAYTYSASLVITDTLDTTIYYKARCRALSHHVCDIHDTMVWGPWSNEVHFYTSIIEPDSINPVCPSVEGFHYTGIFMGLPCFAWETAREQTTFTIEYAPRGTENWRWFSVVRTNNTVLYGNFSLRTYYKARIRPDCRHVCNVHDTVMYGDWSDSIFFFTGLENSSASEMSDDGECRLFTLAPNPSHKRVVLSFGHLASYGSPGKITIVDSRGCRVKEIDFMTSSIIEIDLSELPSGFYFVTITTEGKTQRQKITLL